MSVREYCSVNMLLHGICWNLFFDQVVSRANFSFKLLSLNTDRLRCCKTETHTVSVLRILSHKIYWKLGFTD